MMQGYKITDNGRSRKYGIGADSLRMLKEKAKLKFAIDDLHVYHSKDGFEVADEEYFQTFEPQTLFIISGPDDVITTDADYEFDRLRESSPLLKVADIFYEFVERHPAKFRRMIADYERMRSASAPANANHVDCDGVKTRMSLKSEHMEWFAGQEERCKSKEEAMAKRAQDRIRGYYYKTKEDLTRNRLYRNNQRARAIIDEVLRKFRYLLIGCDYFSMMFNRKCERRHDHVQEKLADHPDAAAVPSKRIKQMIKEYTTKHKVLDKWSVSLCSELGDFYCQGPYSTDEGDCSRQHCINPYASRENLILFQVWNLDHQIELSRSILPALLENVRQLAETPAAKCAQHKRPALDISVLEYFLEIFSLKNLKLVHIVCHEKVQRPNKSNGRLICDKCHEYTLVRELMELCEQEAAVDSC